MATDLPDDTQLKRRARRRLIGAIALVLLAVIVLPMIFDAEQKPLDQDVTIQIPAQGDYTAKSQPPAPKAGMPAEPPKAETPAKAEPPPPEAKAEPPKAETTAEPAKTEPPKAEKAAPPKPEAKADAKAAKVPAKSDTDAARDKADAARALALLNGEGTAPKSEKAAEKAADKAEAYAIQIGAFSTEEKVQEVRDKLSGAGLKSYVEKVSTQSGSVTRVRAGPFASRDAAESARTKIAGLGFSSATVVRR